MSCDLTLKINYLLKYSNHETLALLIPGLSGKKIKEFLSHGVPLSEASIHRIEFQFRKQVSEEKMVYLKETTNVKNYDDDDLQDLKAGTSRHGVNRQSSSFATSNNGRET